MEKKNIFYNCNDDGLFKKIISPILELLKGKEEPVNMSDKVKEEENVENKEIKEEDLNR